MSKYLIAILLSAWSISLRAQVAEKLQQLGMENIQTVTEVNGNTTIAFEDNVYRGTYRGIGKAIEAAMEGMYGGNLQMVVLEHSIPQLCITLSDKVITEYKEKQITIGEVYRQMGISYDTDEAMEVLKKTHRTLNSSAGKVDIVVYPEVKLENSSFDRLYTYYVNLAPAVEMALWKGAELTAQVVFPVATNLKGQYKKIRPGVIALSQEFCFGKDFGASNRRKLYQQPHGGTSGDEIPHSEWQTGTGSYGRSYRAICADRRRRMVYQPETADECRTESICV